MDNAASALVDAPVDAGWGGETALVSPGGAVTRRDLLALTDRAARGLRGLGVAAGDRVALLLPDGPEFAAAFLGAIKLGAVAVPLNTRLAPHDHARLLDDAEARVAVAVPALGEPLAAVAPRCRIVGWDALVEAASAERLPAAPAGPDAMAFWLYTSGTTGAPKAAVHGHRTLLAGAGYGRDVLGAGPGDRIFASSKLFFAYALGNALLIPLSLRAQSYLAPGWPDPAGVASVMRDYRPTLFFSVPTFYARALAADLPPATFASARACVSAGERLPREIAAAWRDRFGVEILDGLGATETVFMALSQRPGRSRSLATGGPVPGAEARLLDDDGRPIASGDRGVLWVRTPSVATGYWRRPDATQRAFVDGWFRTGDVCYRDADGDYVHCGRDDDSFKVAGMWVQPAEIEAAALAHPSVLEAGAVGATAATGLVKPFLFVVARDASVPPAALTTALGARLADALRPHQRPQRISVVADLPRTTTGKLQRFRLRELAQAELEAPEADAPRSGGPAAGGG
jgi:benzoate-CoA ligase